MNVIKTNKFPKNSNDKHFGVAQSAEVVFIDGMKVLFDKRVGLSPVKLEKRVSREIPQHDE